MLRHLLRRIFQIHRLSSDENFDGARDEPAGLITEEQTSRVSIESEKEYFYIAFVTMSAYALDPFTV